MCAPVVSGPLAGALALTVLDPEPDQAAADVFTARTHDMVTAKIERWAGLFSDGDLPIATTSALDVGIGRLFASRTGLPGAFVYAPQGATCDGAGKPCIDYCTTAASCTRLRLDHAGTIGNHVNGMVLHGEHAIYTTDLDKRVYATAASCLSQSSTSCPAWPIVDDMIAPTGGGPTTSAYVGVLSRDPVGEKLWWTTVDDADTDTCLYRADMPTTVPTSDCVNCTRTCAVTNATIPRMWGVTTSSLGVFVGTKAPASIFPDGPIYTVDRTTFARSALTTRAAKPLGHPTARFPAEADAELLYAYDDGTSPGRLIAIDPNTDAIVAQVALPDADEGAILHVDASSREWVYFTTDKHLFRWRKPAVGYSQSMP